MATIRSDIIVLGSSPGGLIAGAYLARAGLRVTLLEEAVLARRPPLLRDPFVLSGLESGGGAQRILRELGVPLIEQRKLRRDSSAVQVLVPGARIEVRVGRSKLARELAAFGLLDAPAAEAWLASVASAGDEARARLWQASAPRPASRRYRWLERWQRPRPLEARLPPAPEPLGAFVAAQLRALSGLAGPSTGGAEALLLRPLIEGGMFMPNAGELFSDLLRRRLRELHADIRPLGEFALVSERDAVGLDLPRGRLLARALVLAAPRALVARAAANGSAPPRWLAGGAAPREAPVRLFRAEPETLPVGLGRRAIVASGQPESLHWIARYGDPDRPGVEWLAIGGPGAERLAADHPLGGFHPLPNDGIAPADPGPAPAWDRDASDLRFPAALSRVWLRQRPPVVAVGAEVEPGLGFEGELLRSRATALHLIDRLGARRPPLAVSRIRPKPLEGEARL